MNQRLALYLMFAVLSLVVGCRGRAAQSARGDASVDSQSGANAWWLEYPEAPTGGQWETVELDEKRYLDAVVETACLNRDYKGTPEQKEQMMSRIFFHHKTNAQDIVAYGRRTNNAPPAEAQRIGELLADRIERCSK